MEAYKPAVRYLVSKEGVGAAEFNDYVSAEYYARKIAPEVGDKVSITCVYEPITQGESTMIQHKCAWCGADATHDDGCRYYCDCDSPVNADDARDKSGENGPETWVDVGEMPAPLLYISRRLGNTDAAVHLSKEFWEACNDIVAGGTFNSFRGHPVAIDPNATEHVRIGEAKPLPDSIDGELVVGKPGVEHDFECLRCGGHEYKPHSVYDAVVCQSCGGAVGRARAIVEKLRRLDEPIPYVPTKQPESPRYLCDSVPPWVDSESTGREIDATVTAKRIEAKQAQALRDAPLIYDHCPSRGPEPIDWPERHMGGPVKRGE